MSDEYRVPFNPRTHIAGKVYTLDKENMFAMIDYIDVLEIILTKMQQLLSLREGSLNDDQRTSKPHSKA